MSNELDIDGIIKALSNPVRREILTWLKEPEKHFQSQEHTLENGVCVGRIYERAGLSQSTISAYLAILQRAGLVTSQRVGQWVFYKRNESVILAFLEYLKNEL
ncbi:ArsR/SmtB family transcription factor [Beggiatoa leptomitoformis]|uniref:Metalloregulator ArsR/SmtB family transcription factor n=1 Tax=Beggiatoa leptomitoformis TaxID=288004 RepID=A0A2N9YFV1_9GAMM|nr:metalloregulator ArsR/SmtB family transcription factor [Beggiatoa leptomitoformis]ALG68311.1 metalloregulator ArsR/SmtB family transcription factor [Beggiatoa leptomitoformis]AUI69374.1 metalloregulator ArsR/SmtB family transcription factor [Beggiatoa leptomitoformis]